jgi:hypothetical protein
MSEQNERVITCVTRTSLILSDRGDLSKGFQKPETNDFLMDRLTNKVLNQAENFAVWIVP